MQADRRWVGCKLLGRFNRLHRLYATLLEPLASWRHDSPPGCLRRHRETDIRPRPHRPYFIAIDRPVCQWGGLIGPMPRWSRCRAGADAALEPMPRWSRCRAGADAAPGPMPRWSRTSLEPMPQLGPMPERRLAGGQPTRGVQQLGARSGRPRALAEEPPEFARTRLPTVETEYVTGDGRQPSTA
jgi:hypothetical protein